jgi:hypothetical protein
MFQHVFSDIFDGILPLPDVILIPYPLAIQPFTKNGEAGVLFPQLPAEQIQRVLRLLAGLALSEDIVPSGALWFPDTRRLAARSRPWHEVDARQTIVLNHLFELV